MEALQAIENYLTQARMDKEEIYMPLEYVVQELANEGIMVHRMQVARVYWKHGIKYQNGLWRKQI